MNVKKINSSILLCPDTAYLTGMIVGDGYIMNAAKSKRDSSPDYRVGVDISDEKHLRRIYQIIKLVTNTKSTPKRPKQRENRVPRLKIDVRNKELFYFLTKDMGLPKGKKSSTVTIPRRVINGSEEIKKHFMAGYFDADGGFRGKTLGFTTASERLRTETSDLLNEWGISHSQDSWIHKKYDKRFYGIRMKKNQIDTFLNLIPIRNTEKLVRIRDRFHAEMPEWSNGTV